VIQVIDDGPGIGQEHKETIFEPFTRLDSGRASQSKGAGLGLWIVRQILKAHGGTVELTSDQSGQTCFSMRWPVDPEALRG